MIGIHIKDKNYTSDIQPLVKSFYPDEEISVAQSGSFISREAVLFEISINLPEDEDRCVSLKLNENEYREMPSYGEGNAALIDAGDKVAIRNCMKRLLYKALSEYSGKTLPWGCLTGIRPTRIALSRLLKGICKEEIASVLKNTYYVSDEKISLCLEIAEREKAIIDKNDYREGYSLYVGIPFCPTTCLYCSFASNPIVSWQDRIGDYLDAVKLELKATADLFKGRRLNSVYVGGGTPTALLASQMDTLLEMIREYFDLSYVEEFTVESGRPDSITEDKLLVMKSHGVDRISINPQTMKDETLKVIGRRHTVKETIDAFNLARDVGFTNINMDIILGLPGETLSDVRHTMEEIEKLSPDSLTVHSLAVKRAAALPEWMAVNGTDSIMNTPEMMAVCEESAKKQGLLPYYLYRQKNMAGNYENVGYAKEDCFGLYNILMMEEVQSIVACGAGTISKRVSLGDGVNGSNNITRCDNVKDVGLFIEKIDEMIERKRKLFS